MRLYDRFDPVWSAGEKLKLIRVGQEVSRGSTRLVEVDKDEETSAFHFRVVGPRFTLPPAEVLASYPIPGSDGAIDTRLPHVALRRRTLPWERKLEPIGASTTAPPGNGVPWMALLLFPADAVSLVRGTAADALSPAQISALGLDAAEPCDHVVVHKDLLKAVMPFKEELRYLCHARQVSLASREAKGDDDGFMAIVICNRLPAPSARHLACLVSLEGQWDADIWPAPQLQLPWRGNAATGAGERSDPVLGAAPGGGGPQPSGDPPLDRAHVRRLVVLHAWTFTSGEGGDFEAHLQRIRAKGGVRRLGGDAPADAAGFVPIEHRERDGSTGEALYRGPCAPVPLAREDGVATSADAALALSQDGQPLLSHGAAFELGRLLTTTSHEAMRALQRFRGHETGMNVEKIIVKAYCEHQEWFDPAGPVTLEDIFTNIWDGDRAMNLPEVTRCQADPSGILHLMEAAPGLSWAEISAHKPGLDVDFNSARSAKAKAQLSISAAPAVVAQPGALHVAIGDAALGIALDVALPHVALLAVDDRKGGI